MRDYKSLFWTLTTATPFPDSPAGLEGQTAFTYRNKNTGGQTLKSARPTRNRARLGTWNARTLNQTGKVYRVEEAGTWKLANDVATRWTADGKIWQLKRRYSLYSNHPETITKYFVTYPSHKHSIRGRHLIYWYRIQRVLHYHKKYSSESTVN